MSELSPDGLVQRLRDMALREDAAENFEAQDLLDAADEIERLRQQVSQVEHERDTTHAELIHLQNAVGVTWS